MREAAVQDGRRGGLEPLVQQRGVDAAEVGVHPQVTVVGVGEAGVLAVDAALDRAADQKHDAGRAVVSARRAVLFDAPTELGKGHGDDIIGPALGFEIGVKGTQAVGKVSEQIGVGPGLVD